MERLTFNTTRARIVAPSSKGRAPAAAAAKPARPAAPLRDRYDWDYLWMLTFTALLFFRPQDQIPGLHMLHLAELTALAGLAAMAVRRLNAGLPVARITPEVAGVVALGAIILLTSPFSIWPGGSVHVFTDIYIKVILIFALMVSTLTTPRRLRQLTWLMVLASAYIALRANIDYLRGVNLVEGNRIRGAVGGMFENPNDLALNMATFMAPALFMVLYERRGSRRLLAAAAAGLMFATIVFTKSRSGFLGLAAMLLVAAYFTLRARPGAVVAGLLALLLAVPMLPQSFWTRMNSIVVAQEDPTGSREARIHLFQEGMRVFAQNPITGIGAGQFKNYTEPGRQEKWRVTHDVWLQVAAELGLLGLLTFAFLVMRGFSACVATLRALRPRRRKVGVGPRAPAPQEDAGLDPAARRMVELSAQAMLAAFAAWFVCAIFASVAFNWTLYYILALAVSGRDIAVAHRAPVTAPERTRMPQLARAHA
jgi:O-antigen ligase